MKAFSGKTVLVAEDDATFQKVIASAFEDRGAQVVTAEGGERAFGIIQETRIDLVVSDVRMPGGSGIDLLKNVSRMGGPMPPLILVTGFSVLSEREAQALGAFVLLEKPFKLEELLELAQRCLDKAAPSSRS